MKGWVEKRESSVGGVCALASRSEFHPSPLMNSVQDVQEVKVLRSVIKLHFEITSALCFFQSHFASALDC